MLEEQKEEIKKTWEYENGMPVNFKVTYLDKEYIFVHPHEHEKIVNELNAKIVELEKSNMATSIAYISQLLRSKLIKT
jgi:hypothetical protein